MLDTRAYGLAMGFVYSAYMALLAWAGGFLHLNGDVSRLLRTLYPGYGFSLKGGIVGAGYGFAMGFLFGWATSWLYNQLKKAPRGVAGNLAPMD